MLQLADFQIAEQLPTRLASLATGNNNHRLKQLTIDALKACGGAVAYVSVRYDGKIFALATSGLVDGRYSVDATMWDNEYLRKLELEDFVANEDDLRHVAKAYAHIVQGLHISYFINCVLPFDHFDEAVKVSIVDFLEIGAGRSNDLRALQELARIAAKDISPAPVATPRCRTGAPKPALGARANGEHRFHEDTSAFLPPSELPAEGGEDGSVVGDFLLRTLIEKPQLRTRNGIHYSGLATWKKSVKDAQIRALFALKKHLPDDFVATLSERFAASVDRSIGRSAFKYVVAVPCGSSGPDCLSQKLAQEIAVRLGSEFAAGFERFPKLGTSHPKNNARLSPPKTLREFDGPVLLIDDVATSGSHIELSTKALRKVAPAVFSMVWICD